MSTLAQATKGSRPFLPPQTHVMDLIKLLEMTSDVRASTTLMPSGLTLMATVTGVGLLSWQCEQAEDGD